MVAAGILLVDKPGGMTSHDVVARARRALGTRKIGHAGTLDPMATGLLVLGVEAATRLLTYVVGADKTYLATIRLGQTTSTDDADGEIVATAPEESWGAVTPERVAAGIAELTGAISQVPSAVSAIKVDGRRAYDRVRAGEQVELAARRVTVSRFDIVGVREGEGIQDIDVRVDCSSGTYVRALARDLGEALGVGGHLTSLRRTRIGPFLVDAAVPVDALGEGLLMPAAEAAARILPVLHMDAAEATDLRHGKTIADAAHRLAGERAAALDPDGRLIGIVEAKGTGVKSAMNMPEDPR